MGSIADVRLIVVEPEPETRNGDSVAVGHPTTLRSTVNQLWHSAIIAGSGNKVVSQTLDRLSVPINRMLFESFYDVERLRTANADHQAITAAILISDAAAAESHMRRHVEEGFKTLSSIAREFS